MTRLSQFACPQCGAALDHPTVNEAVCAADGTSFRYDGGIWHLIAPDRKAYFERFVGEYDYVRRMEGRGARSAAYFRGLPFEDASGQFRSDWGVRAESYTCFVRNVLERMEEPALRGAQQAGELKILDLGAGNCWMSNRMAERGHAVVAVDLRTGTEDGLGAHAYYENQFEVVRAEFDRLPFRDAAFDVVVFNASFHYSESYEKTLNEALRVLRPGGRIAILDTPLYRDAASGEAMVRERTSRFERRYGVASDSLSSEEYLTEERLRQLSVRCGITWTFHRPAYDIGWMIRRRVSGIRNRREAARFAVIEGARGITAGAAVAHMAPTRLLQPIGRAGLTLRYVLSQKHKLGRTTEEDVRGLRLRIPPGVFHPVVFRSGSFLAELLLDGVLRRGARVLDLGCGSGICALAAAAGGAEVTAVDINPEAVSITRRNASSNGLEVCALESDLFERAGRFDVVLFNPPYYAGTPEAPFDLAWRSDDVVERFSRELCGHLTPDGFAMVVLSSDGRSGEYLRRFESDGHRISRVVERRFLNETLTVFRLR